MVCKNPWLCRKFQDNLQIFRLVRQFHTFLVFWECLTELIVTINGGDVTKTAHIIQNSILCAVFRKNDLPTLFLLQNNLPAHFCCETINNTLFCRENDPRTFVVAKTILVTIFLSQKRFVKRFCKRVFVAIYAVRPENFCALKFAIRKVQTFWASWVSKQ